MISGLKGRRARPLHQRGGSDRELRSAQPIKDNIGVFLDWDSWDLELVWGVVFGSVLGVVVDGFSGVFDVPEAPSVV